MPDPTSFLGVADPISSLTHLGGALMFLTLGGRMLQQTRGHDVRFLAVAIYIVAVVFTLSVSGIFHMVERGTETRELLVMVDHAAIFFLIAATYAPVHVIQFSGFLRWGVLAIVWAVAIIGGVVKSIFFIDFPEWIGLTLYLSLGWAGLITAVALYRRWGLWPLWPLFGGAAAYTIGAALDFAEVPTIATAVVGPHEVFHLFVLAGVGLHWLYIYRIVENTPAPMGYQPA